MFHSTRLGGLVVGACLVLLVSATTVVAKVPAAGPAVYIAPRWGYVVARNPTASLYTPAPKDQGNSNGGTNSVRRNGPGQYTVYFGSLGTTGGVVHVTALGTIPRICTAGGWGPASPDELVYVDCFDLGGFQNDSAFSVNLIDAIASPGRIAHVYADQPSTVGPYIPRLIDQYDGAGGTITISRPTTGLYQVVIPGLGPTGGDVQITAVATDATCRASWGSGGTTLIVQVMCRSQSGAALDSLFGLTFMQGLALKGYRGSHTAYLRADRPHTASYLPKAKYRFSTSGLSPLIRRVRAGTYVVTLPGQPNGGSVQVTEAGLGTPRCMLTSLPKSGKPMKIGVRCFDQNGGAVDAPFTLAFAR